MSAFWETMATANDLAIDTMGEEVRMGDRTISGVVEPRSWQETTAPGGRRMIVRGEVMVNGKGLEIRDGMPVHLRGVDGKVDGWEDIGGGHLMVKVGPFNRWGGEVPGV